MPKDINIDFLLFKAVEDARNGTLRHKAQEDIKKLAEATQQGDLERSQALIQLINYLVHNWDLKVITELVEKYGANPSVIFRTNRYRTTMDLEAPADVGTYLKAKKG